MMYTNGKTTSLFLALNWALIMEASSGVGIGLVPGEFCYDDRYCDESSGLWPGICKTGTRQSPIDLPLPDASMLIPYNSLTFNYAGYSSDSFNIVDNGHTIEIKLGPTVSPPHVTGYGLDEFYELFAAHFHWNDRNWQGSEHSIGGNGFPMELHLVHYKKSYGSFAAAAAANDPKGLLVIACFIDHSTSTNILSLTEGKYVHYALNPIVTNFPIQYDEEGKNVQQRIDLSPFLPTQGDLVYRYHGSITTPNCSEIVVWTVAYKPYIVDVSDLRKFQYVRDKRNKRINHNNRRTQNLYGRTVEQFKVEYMPVPMGGVMGAQTPPRSWYYGLDIYGILKNNLYNLGNPQLITG